MNNKNNKSNKNIEELNVGKSYNISDVLNLLDRDPNIKIGHGVVFDEHLYHLGYAELNSISENIKNNDALFKKGPAIIKVLAIIDPRVEVYKKYRKFCESIEDSIVDALKHANYKSGVVVKSEQIIENVRNFVVPENVSELVKGMDSYFSRKSIHVTIYGSDDYIIFKYK